jgi:hypothetical protein
LFSIPILKQNSDNRCRFRKIPVPLVSVEKKRKRFSENRKKPKLFSSLLTTDSESRGLLARRSHAVMTWRYQTRGDNGAAVGNLHAYHEKRNKEKEKKITHGLCGLPLKGVGWLVYFFYYSYPYRFSISNFVFSFQFTKPNSNSSVSLRLQDIDAQTNKNSKGCTSYLSVFC